MLRMAVERAFAIIGEALSQLVRVDSAITRESPTFAAFVAFRNILIHAYAQAGDRIVWDIVQSKLHSCMRASHP